MSVSAAITKVLILSLLYTVFYNLAEYIFKFYENMYKIYIPAVKKFIPFEPECIHFMFSLYMLIRQLQNHCTSTIA